MLCAVVVCVCVCVNCLIRNSRMCVCRCRCYVCSCSVCVCSRRSVCICVCAFEWLSECLYMYCIRVCLCVSVFSIVFFSFCCLLRVRGTASGEGGKAWRGGSLGKAKALRALVYGLEQTATQLIIRLVHGQIQLIEAVRERKGGE